MGVLRNGKYISVPWGEEYERQLIKVKEKAEYHASNWDRDNIHIEMYSYMVEMNLINIMLHNKARRTIIWCTAFICAIIILAIIFE